jgi:hypothetical protein
MLVNSPASWLQAATVIVGLTGPLAATAAAQTAPANQEAPVALASCLDGHSYYNAFIYPGMQPDGTYRALAISAIKYHGAVAVSPATVSIDQGRVRVHVIGDAGPAFMELGGPDPDRLLGVDAYDGGCFFEAREPLDRIDPRLWHPRRGAVRTSG